MLVLQVLSMFLHHLSSICFASVSVVLHFGWTWHPPLSRRSRSILLSKAWLWLPQVGIPLLFPDCPVRPSLFPQCKSPFLPTAACTHHLNALYFITCHPSWLTSSMRVLSSQVNYILCQAKFEHGGPFWGMVDSQVLMGLDKTGDLFWNIGHLTCLLWQGAHCLAWSLCQLWTALPLESLHLLICLIKLKCATCPPMILLMLGHLHWILLLLVQSLPE